MRSKNRDCFYEVRGESRIDAGSVSTFSVISSSRIDSVFTVYKVRKLCLWIECNTLSDSNHLTPVLARKQRSVFIVRHQKPNWCNDNFCDTWLCHVCNFQL